MFKLLETKGATFPGRRRTPDRYSPSFEVGFRIAYPQVNVHQQLFWVLVMIWTNRGAKKTMGGASHFSSILPMRCQTLLDELYEEHLPKAPDSDYRLKATFLLSVAMPMIIFPMERIAKYAGGTQSGHINDAPLNQLLADKMQAVLSKPAEASGFFEPGKWAFHRHDMKTLGMLSFSSGLPESISNILSHPAAAEIDPEYTTQKFCNILRNALAHGAVMFLGEDGKSAEDRPVTKFAFVSSDAPGVKEYLFLRVSMDDFREFLRRWTEWLDKSGAEDAIGDLSFMMTLDVQNEQ